MSTTNQAQFSNAIKGWSEKLGIKARTLQKKIAFDLHGELTKRTPVRTGRARSNWGVSVGSPSQELNDQATSPPPFPEIEVTGRDNIYIVNNVHYVPYLNDGTPKMAAIGFRESSIQAVASKVERAVAEKD